MIVGNKVRLREKRLADAPADYSWQTDPELAEFDAVPVPNTTFQQYLDQYASELLYPSSIRNRFAIETLDGEHIGNCTYYDIDNRRGETELGIVIGNRSYWGKGYGLDAVTNLVNHIFQQTKLHRIYLKTLVSNKRAQKCFTKCGFTPYGHLKKDSYNFVLMELHRKQWAEQQDKKNKRE
jgi:RimJ/RimL family protein N-acetyltransferase